jgi:adenine deaminase
MQTAAEIALDRSHLIAVARGDVEPDLVIQNARIFSAFTREWLEGDVAIAGGRFAGIGGTYTGGERVDAQGQYLVPGFMDAHVHIESSKLTLGQFARVVVPHGTTTVVIDPHEIANVLGSDGIHWLLDTCDEHLPLDVYVMVSSCIPASPFESPRRDLTRGDMEAILRRHRALGIAEMMNFPAVIAGDHVELDKLDCHGATHVDGHAPGVRGMQLDAYLAAGISSDHEATTYEEALEKRRKGMWVLIREASNARNLLDLLPLVREHGPERCAFCTDDREPDYLMREGHINQMCRIAVENGVTAEDALVLATLNPALCHHLTDVGAISPGYRAHCQLLPDLQQFAPTRVWVHGKTVADASGAIPFKEPEVPIWVRCSVRIAPVPATDLRIAGSDRIRVIGIVPDQLITESLVEEPTMDGAFAVADAERDLAKIAVIERHHATGRIGLGFVKGFGLTRGAFASTVAHDAHNLVVVGMNDEDMALCAARMEEIGGGIVVADNGQVVCELPLPVAGLLSAEPAEQVVDQIDAIHAALHDMGVGLEAPLMAISFLALSVIPHLKITDLGLVDVDRFQLVPLEV